jgi:cytochrome c553
MMISRRSTLCIFLWIAATGASAAAEPTAQEAEFFEKKIRPVLVERCGNCHSASAPKLKGGLRLDSRAGLLAGGDSGPVLVPGQPDKSRLIEAVGYKNVRLQMPPKSKLSDAVIADLTAWVKMGAPWPGTPDAKVVGKESFDLAGRKASHWAWQPIRDGYPPLLKDDSWPLSTSDRYILGKLEAKGIAPAPTAGPLVLLRRLYFDLVGLPPTPEEIEQFEKDFAVNAQAALGKFVDKLLASPQFGERWGRHWLDLVRYAESRGHEFEPNIPNAFQYRDYVIRALNADVPYNQFVLEHVAGDLLVKPRLHPQEGFNESVIGTGFWHLGEEVHSPVDIRGDEADRFDNRIDVLTKTFLGLTVACARCHDHKFDAISTKDYYALYGFLRSSAYRQVRFDTLEHNRQIMIEIAQLREKQRPAILKAYAETFKPGVGRVPELLKQARAAVLSGKPSDDKLVRLWTDYLKTAAKDPDDPLHSWATLPAKLNAGHAYRHFEKFIPPFGVGRGRFRISPDDGSLVSWYPPHEFVLSYRSNRELLWSPPGAQDNPRLLSDDAGFGLGFVSMGESKFGTDSKRPIVRFYEDFAAEFEPAFSGLKVTSGAQSDHGALGGNFRAGRIVYSPSFVINPGKVHYLVKGNGRAYAAVDGHTVIAGPLHAGLVINFNTQNKFQWVTHDLSAYRGHRAHLEFSPNDDSDFAIKFAVQADKQLEDIRLPGVADYLMTKVFENGSADAPTLTADTIGELLTKIVRAVDNGALIEGRNSRFESAPLANWMLDHPELLGVTDWDKVSAAAKPFLDEQARLTASIRRESRLALAMIDISPVNEHVFIRGSHQSPGEVVPRRFLEALAGTKGIESTGSGRLELAHQMIDPKLNPFIARVIVNRVWHHLFGRGIVASTDNFGQLGERPTHPELLDYLATQFVKDGWSLKTLIRQLVLSRAYQMSSKPDEKADAADPENLLLHRARLRRLQGEAIRDALLQVSGRMNATMYGPSIPIHLTPFLDGRGKPASGPIDGDGRRSIYLAVRRNFLSPFMLAFDTPSPFSTVGRRTVSNVPAQALILMNDPFVHQMADLWGKQIAASTSDTRTRVVTMYKQAFSRPPTVRELADCRDFIAAANKPAADPKPWSDLAHVLINTKEFIFIE